MADIHNFPGVTSDKEEEKITVEKLFEAVKEMKPTDAIVVFLTEDGNIVTSGTTTMAYGVFLLEAGKATILEQT